MDLKLKFGTLTKLGVRFEPIIRRVVSRRRQLAAGAPSLSQASCSDVPYTSGTTTARKRSLRLKRCSPHCRNIQVLAFATAAFFHGAISAQDPCSEVARQAFDRQHWEEVASALRDSRQTVCDRRIFALAQFHMHAFEAALPEVNASLGDAPNDLELNRAALVMDTALGNNAAAEQRAAKLTVLGDDDFANLYRARLSLSSGDPAGAEALLRGLLNAREAVLAQEAADDLIALLQQQGRYGEVAAVAEQALARDPGSFSAYRLKRYAMDDQRALKPLEVSIGYRLEYDDNVALLPDQQGIIFGVSDEEDFRHVLFADVLYRKPLGNHLLFFAEGHGSHSFHHDLDEYDFTRANLVAGLGGSYRNWGWRLPLEYSHDRFDGDAFRDSLIATPGVFVDMWGGLQSYFYMRFSSEDYDRSVSLSEDRSGDTSGGGVLVVGTLGERWSLRVFAELDDVDTDGNNWDRDEWRAQATAEFNLTPDWAIGAGLRYQEADFDNLHDVFLAQRKDETSSAFASLTHWFREHWQIRAQVSYVEQESTLSIYDFDRTVISLGVSYDF